MKKTAIATLALVAGSAATANAQSMKFYWEVDGVRTNDVTVAPGSTINVTLNAEWSPPAIGFAGSIFAIEDVSSSNFFGANAVDIDPNNGNGRNPVLSSLSGDNGTNLGNRIDQIDTFQLPPFFNPGFDGSNPMWLYSMDITVTTGGELRRAAANNGTFTADVYIDTFGSSTPYQADDNTLSIAVPAPSSLALLGCGGLAAARRRR